MVKEFTEIGKLYARLVHNGSRIWADGVPTKYRNECYDAYTCYYKFKPKLTPINEQNQVED